jgi:hypothetical protein
MVRGVRRSAFGVCFSAFGAYQGNNKNAKRRTPTDEEGPVTSATRGAVDVRFLSQSLGSARGGGTLGRAAQRLDRDKEKQRNGRL